MNCTKEESWALVEKYWQREWDKIKQIEFPKTREFEINGKECIREVASLRDNDKANKTPSKTIIKFHPSMIYANKRNCLSPYDYWQSLKTDPTEFKRFYENRLRCSDWFNEKHGANFHYLNEGFVPEFIYGIGMTTSRRASKVSYFKPALAKNIIKKYLSYYDTIFDPCSGYSGRLIGALCADKNYIGYDLNDITIEESKKLYKFISLCFHKKVELYCKNSLEEAGEFDCLFTCTPYADIESWKSSNGVITSNLSCDQWIDKLLENYKCKRYVFVTDENIVKYKGNVVEELENTSHFGSNKEFIVVV